jgi:hypothetical protein
MIKLISVSKNVFILKNLSLSSVLKDISEYKTEYKSKYTSEDTILEVPIPFNDEIIEKLIEFCNLYDNDATIEWIENVNFEILFGVLRIADFLEIDPLIQICCDKISMLIKNKNVQELETYFNTAGHITTEEYEEFKNNHEWIYK